jgi:hypothetical protein
MSRANKVGTLAGLVTAVISLTAPTIAQAAEKADCRISAVQASVEGSGEVPAELDFMRAELESPQFAGFKSFSLLDAKSLSLDLGKVKTTRIKPAHTVKLELLAADKRLSLHASIQGKSSSLVDMDYRIEDKGLMLFPVMRGDDAIIFAIQCATKA